jgi:protein ImuB
MRRILSIWLPHLAVERWARSNDFAPDACPERSRGEPVVLTVEGTHGLVIHAVTKAAVERGARAGARLTDARALDPSLVAVPADPAGDAALVERLARWAGRWSPLVEMDGHDALRLDVTGVGHLFGGEEGLVADVRERFAVAGLSVRTAIAPTAAAAWALARYSPSPLCGGGSTRAKSERGEGPSHKTPPLPGVAPRRLSLPRGGGRDLLAALSPFPVAALRLESETIRTLERLGLKTIGALLDVPRLSLARRFRGAEDVVDALDRALGRKPEPLTATPSEPPPRALLKLEEPATHPEAPAQALERLIPDLVRQLQQRHLGARRLALIGYRVDGSIAVAAVATAIPSREPKHLQRLLVDKAAALDPGFGFDAFALQTDWAEGRANAQESLVEEPTGEHEVARLVDRLSVKLGPDKVRRPQAFESHLPERASGWVAAITSPSPLRGGGRGPRSGGRERGSKLTGPSPRLRCAQAAPPPQRGEGPAKRPQRLLDRPEAIAVVYATPEGVPRRFVWRRAVHDIARVEGPERIAPEWWRQPSTARLRDYYRVEDQAGRRYWIYREGVIGDGRGGLPEWYLHGLFG